MMGFRCLRYLNEWKYELLNSRTSTNSRHRHTMDSQSTPPTSHQSHGKGQIDERTIVGMVVVPCERQTQSGEAS